MTLAETEAQIGKMRRLTASHYDDCRHDRFNPCGLTSSGEVYRADKPDNAASAIHPDGTILLLRNPTTGHAAVVRVNNFGPFHANRKLDVSRATAERLGFARRGVTSLEVMVVYAPTAAEARYQRKRRYDPVPGYIGGADSFDTAYLRYADMTLHKRIARRDAVACQIADKRRAPRLKLVASLTGEAYMRFARN
jgi:rare lipoprotein A